MDRRYVAGLTGLVAFVVLFATAVTPLLSFFFALGLSNTAATLITWFVVVLIPIGLTWLINRL